MTELHFPHLPKNRVGYTSMMGQATDSQYACAFIVSGDLIDMATSPGVNIGPSSGRLDTLRSAIGRQPKGFTYLQPYSVRSKINCQCDRILPYSDGYDTPLLRASCPTSDPKACQ